jgi:hypothetical protein
MALFVALAWQVFSPMLNGSYPAGPGRWFWLGMGFGVFFLALGLTARQQLSAILGKANPPSSR